MTYQRCPNCQKRIDVSVYVHGQQARCSECTVRFVVDREQAEPGRGHHSQITPQNGVLNAAQNAAHSAETALAQAVQGQAAQGQAVQGQAGAPNGPAAVPAPAAGAAGGEPQRPEIPGYEILALLGRGGMGEVWKARQLSLKRVVAVKVLSPNLAVEPDFVRRFERESSALAALSHPHIVQVYDRGNQGRHWYFTMELVEGRSLRDKPASGSGSRQELLRVMAQVARAIDYAHQKGVIHRDLKPENILLDPQGNAKVADFGLAGMNEAGASHLTMTAVAMGTAHYMAPEQRKDAKNVDGRADLYSLGVMLYELLTGEIPAGRFKTPRQKVPDLDPRLDELILKLLDPEPHRRPRRALEVAALLDVVVHGPRSTASVTVPPPVRRAATPEAKAADARAQRTKQWLFVGAGALMALIVGVSVWRAAAGRPSTIVVSEETPGATSLRFGRDTVASMQVDAGNWSVEDEQLETEAPVTQGRASFQRAWLPEARTDIARTTLEADVAVTPAATEGASGAAELLLKGDRESLALRLHGGSEGKVQLVTGVGGLGQERELTGGKFSLETGKAHHVMMLTQGGRVTVTVDGRPVGSSSVAGLLSGEARLGFGCRSARCGFSGVRLVETPDVATTAAAAEPVTPSPTPRATTGGSKDGGGKDNARGNRNTKTR